MTAPSAPNPGGPDGRAPVTSEAATALFRRSLRDVLVFLAVLAVLGVVVGWATAGSKGAWGALLGAAVAFVFSGTTVWSMWRSAHSTPAAMLGIVAGSWLAKMVVLIVALVSLQGQDFYSKPVFLVVVLVGVLGSVALDTVNYQRARVPYVEPRQG
jgi:multisubunit Na+/H+ antiporter MnhF subunit